MWKGIAIFGIWGSLAAIAFSGAEGSIAPLTVGATIATLFVAAN